MLKDGEKGAILQRDKATYAVVPHMVCGLTDPATLRKIADAAEKHNLTIKLTGAQRVALIGMRADQVDQVWADLDMPKGQVVGNTVRSVKACPGIDFCKRGQQDSLAMGKALDQRYHGMPLPGKLKLGASGCLFQCAETSYKDIGLVGKPKGWTILVGGCGGGKPRIGVTLAEDLTTELALEMVDKIIEFFKANARPHDRLGRLLDRVGMAAFREAVGAPAGYVEITPA